MTARSRALSFQARPQLSTALVLAALGLGACNTDSNASAAAATGAQVEVSSASGVNARAEGVTEMNTRLSIKPALGGSVLLVGDYQVEVAVHENGAVRGLVFDASGKPVLDRAALDFTVTLHAQSGADPKVKLAWDEACKCFSGRAALEGGLTTEPIDVALGVGGKVDMAELDAYALLPALQVDGSKSLTATAQAKLDAKPPAAGAKLAADAKVKAPAVKATADARSGANVSAKAAANVSVPKPAVQLKVNQSTGTGSKAGAGVKAGASFGFGTK